MQGRDHHGTNDGNDVYLGLRANALDAANGIVRPTPAHPDVAGLVVDIPADGGHATIVALADNTTSLYTSTGGGVIGAGEHPEVAAVTHRLLETVQRYLGRFDAPDSAALPPGDVVRLHLLAPSGNSSADIPETVFWQGVPHELLPVVAAVHDVMTAIRTSTPPDR